MKEKKKVLLVSFIGVCILVLLFLLGTTSCYRNEVCNQIDKSIPDSNIFIIIFMSPVIFLFSLITYRMRDNVFRAWWNFARWWMVVIVVVTLFLNANESGGIGISGLGSGIFDFVLISTLYIIMVIVSVVRIILGLKKK